MTTLHPPSLQSVKQTVPTTTTTLPHPSIPVKQTVKSTYKPICKLNGDQLPMLRKIKRPELSSRTSLYNHYTKELLNTKLTVSFKQHEHTMDTIRKEQAAVYKSLCKMKRLQRLVQKRENEERRETIRSMFKRQRRRHMMRRVVEKFKQNVVHKRAERMLREAADTRSSEEGYENPTTTLSAEGLLKYAGALRRHTQPNVGINEVEEIQAVLQANQETTPPENSTSTSTNTKSKPTSRRHGVTKIDNHHLDAIPEVVVVQTESINVSGRGGSGRGRRSGSGKTSTKVKTTEGGLHSDRVPKCRVQQQDLNRIPSIRVLKPSHSSMSLPSDLSALTITDYPPLNQRDDSDDHPNHRKELEHDHNDENSNGNNKMPVAVEEEEDSDKLLYSRPGVSQSPTAKLPHLSGSNSGGSRLNHDIKGNYLSTPLKQCVSNNESRRHLDSDSGDALDHARGKDDGGDAMEMKGSGGCGCGVVVVDGGVGGIDSSGKKCGCGTSSGGGENHFVGGSGNDSDSDSNWRETADGHDERSSRSSHRCDGIVPDSTDSDGGGSGGDGDSSSSRRTSEMSAPEIITKDQKGNKRNMVKVIERERVERAKARTRILDEEPITRYMRNGQSGVSAMYGTPRKAEFIPPSRKLRHEQDKLIRKEHDKEIQSHINIERFFSDVFKSKDPDMQSRQPTLQPDETPKKPTLSLAGMLSQLYTASDSVARDNNNSVESLKACHYLRPYNPYRRKDTDGADSHETSWGVAEKRLQAGFMAPTHF